MNVLETQTVLRAGEVPKRLFLISEGLGHMYFRRSQIRYQNIQLYVKKSGEERNQYRSALKAADNYDDTPLKQMIEQKLARFPE